MNTLLSGYGGLFFDAGLMFSGIIIGKIAKLFIDKSINHLTIEETELKENEFKTVCFNVIAMACILVGISGININNPITCMVALVLGPLCGYALDLDTKFQNFVRTSASNLFSGDSALGFAEPFIGFLLLTLVGTLSVQAPIEQVLNHNPSLFLIKACLDGITVVIFMITYDNCQAISAASTVVVVADIIMVMLVTLASSSDFLVRSLNDTASVGSVLLLALAGNLLNLTHIKTVNFLPALAITMLFSF